MGDHMQGVQQAPGTLKYISSRDTERSGDRLYRDAMHRQVKIRQLQVQRSEKQRQEEEREATFSPAIETSQRACQGIGRSLRDPQGATTKKKLQDMRQAKERTQLNGCTFKPEIDERSELLMSQRIARLKIRGNLYEHLYEDAQRRHERQVEYDRLIPSGVTFQPHIDHETRHVVHRLSVKSSERVMHSSQETPRETRQQEFHPQTGRSPVERNKDNLPVGEYLFETARERATQSRDKMAEMDRVLTASSVPKMGDVSRQLFEERKQQTYRELFDALTVRDPDQTLRFTTLRLDNLSQDLTDFLKPMVAYLEETKAEVDFETFCAALDYQRHHSATPTAHLFVPRSRSSERQERRESSESKTPRLRARSRGSRETSPRENQETRRANRVPSGTPRSAPRCGSWPPDHDDTLNSEYERLTPRDRSAERNMRRRPLPLSCRETNQTERAVGHCKSMVAIARTSVAAVDV